MVCLRLASGPFAVIRLVACLGGALLLAACGGGGGGGGGAGSNADLGDLSLSSGSLDQIFQSDQTSYTATVPFLVAALGVIATADDAGATIRVDGATVASGSARRVYLAEGSNAVEIAVTAADGATTRTYDLVITRQAAAQFAQQAYVKASNTDGNDRFGHSVALAGDTLAVGAVGEDSGASGVDGDESDDSASAAGAVYVFTRDGTGAWSQQAYIKASNTDPFDAFGRSVALAGDTLAVGANGEDSGASGVNGDESDNGEGQPGAVYVFTRDGTGTWSQQAYIKASNPDGNDEFGRRVALAGDTLAVGAWREDSSATGVNGDESNNSASGAGAVYVFTRDGTDTWSQQAYIKASNTDAGDNFGTSVALAGDTLAVGAVREASSATGVNGDEADNGASGAGAVYVFTRDGTGAWSQQAYLKASNTDGNDVFGSSVALAGDTLAVGAISEDSGATGVNGDEADNNASSAGAVYVFTRDGTGTWSQQAYIKASNTDADDDFGHMVALAGDTLAVGAPIEDSGATGVNGDEADESASRAGAVYVFTRDGTGAWSQQAYVKASNTDASDAFGRGVALAGDTLVVGAPIEASGATGVNGDEADNTVSSAGAVYIRR